MRRSPLLISVLLAAVLLAEGCGTLSRLIATAKSKIGCRYIGARRILDE